jgi:hypothetical protein
MAPGILADNEATTNTTTAASHETVIKQASKSITIAPVLTASLITTEFDPLRFEAAASLQLLQSSLSNHTLPTDYNLISSPYNDPLHLLDLQPLSLQNAILAKALTLLKPIVPDYATAEYTTSFNWDVVLDAVRKLSKEESVGEWKQQSFYAVIFRSKLNGHADRSLLHDLDKYSHGEATVSGGLLKYWFGSCDGERRNLATCTSYFRYLHLSSVSLHLEPGSC